MNLIANHRRHRGTTPLAAFFTYQRRTRVILCAAVIAGIVLAITDAAGQLTITGFQPNSGPPGTRINIAIDGLDQEQMIAPEPFGLRVDQQGPNRPFSVEVPPGFLLMRRGDMSGRREVETLVDGVLEVDPNGLPLRRYYEASFDSFFDVTYP